MPIWDGIQAVVNLLGLAVSALSLIGLLIREAAMKRHMQRYAELSGFEWLGRKLPEGFLFYKTGLRHAEISNVVKGKFHGTDVVAFIASITAEDGGVQMMQAQTVIAFPNARGLGSRQIRSTGNPNIYFDVAGDWFVLYERGRVVPGDRLAGWVKEWASARSSFQTMLLPAEQRRVAADSQA